MTFRKPKEKKLQQLIYVLPSYNQIVFTKVHTDYRDRWHSNTDTTKLTSADRASDKVIIQLIHRNSTSIKLHTSSITASFPENTWFIKWFSATLLFCDKSVVTLRSALPADQVNLRTCKDWRFLFLALQHWQAFTSLGVSHLCSRLWHSWLSLSSSGFRDLRHEGSRSPQHRRARPR